MHRVGLREPAEENIRVAEAQPVPAARNYSYQLSNTQGNAPARLLHYNSLPMAMAIIPDPKVFFDNPYADEGLVYGGDDFYSEAKVYTEDSPRGGARAMWYGNFFADMRAWDKLVPFRGRGAAGT